MSRSGITLADIRQYVEDNIGSFHLARLDSVRDLALKQILKRKNPYLFKAKYVISAPDLVKLLLDAHLSSQRVDTTSENGNFSSPPNRCFQPTPPAAARLSGRSLGRTDALTDV